MTAATCRKVQGAFARDRLEPELAAAMSRHLRDCPDCRAQDRRRGQIGEAILTADDALDDLTRAHVLVRLLEAQREESARGATAERARARTWIGWALGISAAAILLIAVVPRSGRHAPEAKQSFQPVTLEPYAVRSSADASSGFSGRGKDRVALLAGASMHARLGRAADLTLLGPLELAVRNGDERVVVLDLKRGTLIGDLDGSAGRSLHIATPDAVIDIVGTRFLVEVSAGRTRVSVEHGRVRVESRGQVHLLEARQEWTTDRAETEPLGAEGATLFEGAAQGELEALAPHSSEAVRAPSRTGQSASRPAHSVAAHGELALAEPTRRAATPRGADHLPPPSRRVALSEDAAPPATGESSRAPRPEPPAAIAPAPRPEAPNATARAVARADLPAPQKPREETSSSLYRGAETALRRGDDVAARRLLDQLVRTFPNDPMTDAARYELALMAEKAGNANEVRAQTREILRPGAQGPFVDPARFLRCRITLTEDKVAAALCLSRFISDFPQSPHDEVALQALIDLAREGRRCADAKQFGETYLQRHPHGRFAAEAERARRHCED